MKMIQGGVWESTSQKIPALMEGVAVFDFGFGNGITRSMVGRCVGLVLRRDTKSQAFCLTVNVVRVKKLPVGVELKWKSVERFSPVPLRTDNGGDRCELFVGE